MRKIVVAVLLVLASCGPSGTGAELTRVGSSVRAERIGVGGVVRAREGARNVVIGITMLADGRQVAVEQDTLAFCPPATGCWWGTSFQTEGRNIDAVRTHIISVDAGNDDPAEPRELEVTANDRAVEIRAPGREGVVYLLAFRDGRPRFGISFFTRADERSRLRYTQALFPRRANETVRAFFYPGPAPASVVGGSD
jgi:hypothetical protein